MALAANHMNGFNKANRRCEDPWFQDVSRCEPGKIYYQRFFFNDPNEVPRMVKYKGPIIDPEHPEFVHEFVFHPERIIMGEPAGLETPAVLDNSCLREVPGQDNFVGRPRAMSVPKENDGFMSNEENGYMPPRRPGNGGGGGAGMDLGGYQAGGKRKRKTNRKSRRKTKARKTKSRQGRR